MPGFVIQGSGAPGGGGNSQETLRNNRWRISILGPVSGSSIYFAKDVKLPEFTIENQEIMGGLLYYKFAKAVRWDDVTMSFYDTGATYKAMDVWRKLVFEVTTGLKSHRAYKQDVKIELLDGKGTVENIYTLKNAWPQKVGHTPLTYTDSQIKLVNLVLSYDWAEQISMK